MDSGVFNYLAGDGVGVGDDGLEESMKYPHLGELLSLVNQPSPLVTQRKHPTLDLYIYNYTLAVMSLPIEAWPEALKDARGLILNGVGEVVARGFRKFWNLEQVMEKVPVGEGFTVSNKYDGSLGILFLHQGRVIVATRGSFESEQAQWAQKHYPKTAWEFEKLFKPGFSYLFEIIYPENRIVVDYHGEEKMVLLTVITPDGSDNLEEFDRYPGEKAEPIITNKTFFYTHFASEEDFIGAKPITPQDLAKLEANYPGEEGFVVRWESGFRAKVKFEEYKRLHRLITQVSTRSIWELLRAGKDCSELMERVPENFKRWVEHQVMFMQGQFSGAIQGAYLDFSQSNHVNHSRKEFAEWAKQHQWPHLLFAIYDHKAIGDMVWKMLEPKWATPFRIEGRGE